MNELTMEELEPIAKELSNDLNALNSKYRSKLNVKQLCGIMLGASMHNAYMSAPNFAEADRVIDGCRGFAKTEALLHKATEKC